jgi:hypothetical protein
VVLLLFSYLTVSPRQPLLMPSSLQRAYGYRFQKKFVD